MPSSWHFSKYGKCDFLVVESPGPGRIARVELYRIDAEFPDLELEVFERVVQRRVAEP